MVASGARAEPVAKPLPTLLAAKGYTLVGKPLLVQLRSNGAPLEVAACANDEGLSLCVTHATPEKRTWKGATSPLGGSKLKSLRAEDVVPGVAGDEIIVEVYGATPDEKIKRIEIFTAGAPLRSIFKNAVFRSTDKRERPAWERDRRAIRFGDPRPGWFFTDDDENGTPEIRVRRRAQYIQVPVEKGRVGVVTGVREALYQYVGDALSGQFEQQRERIVEFAERREPVRFATSSQWLPEDVEHELSSVALAHGGAGDEADAAVLRARQEYLQWASDRNLDTAWVEGKKGVGEGEWVELAFEDAEPVHMVRVVAGCVADKRWMRDHDEPVVFTLQFDGRHQTLVDRDQLLKPRGKARAMIELPVKDKPWARQTIIFFDGSIKAQRVRLTIDKVDRAGRKRAACVSEIDVR